MPWPPQGLYVNKKVDSVADLKGMKFRAYNAATARIAELAGMVPVQIEAADLSQALATGVAKLHLVRLDRCRFEGLGTASYFYNVQAWLPRNVVFVNKDIWDGLDDATQKVVTDCGDEAAARGLKDAEELGGRYLKTLADHGMNVGPPSDELKKQFEGFGETMTEEWLKRAGTEGKAIIDAYKAK